MGTDSLFAGQKEVLDFSFDEKVASVFDDMVHRSVPFYNEVQRMFIELAQDFVQDDSTVYDLGCSTGTTLTLLTKAIRGRRNISIVGVDNAGPMLEMAREKLATLPSDIPSVVLQQSDIAEGIELVNPSVVLLNWTLQFIRPIKREQLLQNIFDRLKPNGCLLLSEKILLVDQKLNRKFIDYYLRLKKRNNYNDQEIAKKREALENVLIPYRKQENIDLLTRMGFQPIEVFFQWYNFISFIAVKPQ